MAVEKDMVRLKDMLTEMGLDSSKLEEDMLFMLCYYLDLETALLHANRLISEGEDQSLLWCQVMSSVFGDIVEIEYGPKYKTSEGKYISRNEDTFLLLIDGRIVEYKHMDVMAFKVIKPDMDSRKRILECTKVYEKMIDNKNDNNLN